MTVLEIKITERQLLESLILDYEWTKEAWGLKTVWDTCLAVEKSGTLTPGLRHCSVFKVCRGIFPEVRFLGSHPVILTKEACFCQRLSR